MCLDPVLRSLNISKSFSTSLDSVNYIRTAEVPEEVSGLFDAAFFPTETGFDLTFGGWGTYNSTIYPGKYRSMEYKKWQYDITTERWMDTGIILSNWFEISTSRRVSSSMTSWIPSLKKGFLFGGVFFSISVTLEVTMVEEHNGLITYDQATNTWTNETTPFGGISDGSLVHITTATDEVLIQFGGRSGVPTSLVCRSSCWISPRKILIVSGRENFPRSISTAQPGQGGTPNIYHLVLWCRILDSHSALLLNQLRTVLAIKFTLWGALKLVN